MPLDFERARFNMVEQQVRPWEVLDQRVLDVLRELRREEYVPSRWRRQAFADVSLPLEHGEVMMKPVVEGRMLQALAVTPEDAILEIGTGSGFITACLARLGREVHSVEIHAAVWREIRVPASVIDSAPASGERRQIQAPAITRPTPRRC